MLPDGSRATAAAPSAAPEPRCSSSAARSPSAGRSPTTRPWPGSSSSACPGVRVVNRGVNAYGTYQALLLLEELFARGERPARVVYAFHEVHEERNVAAPRWLRMLDENARRGNVAVPYATLDAAGALRAPPGGALPGRGRCARGSRPSPSSSACTPTGRARPRGAGAAGHAAPAARDARPVRAPRRRASRWSSCRRSRRRAALRALPRSSGIPFTDCVVPIPPALRVPGEGPRQRQSAVGGCVETLLRPPRDTAPRVRVRPRRRLAARAQVAARAPAGGSSLGRSPIATLRPRAA